MAPVSLRILLVGGGGREHALAWKLAQSPLVEHVWAIPGNGGFEGLSKVSTDASVNAGDFAALLAFAVDNKVNLVVPGPEQPLVDGITDYFAEHGPARIKVFGPSKKAAEMEGSKAFSKEFMKRHKIPTAASETFTDHAQAAAYLTANKDKRWVIKASGLAAGKGVIIPETLDEARAAVRSVMVDREFGSAGDEVVIEEFLEGDEISVLTLSDGHTALSLPAAQDHKRAEDGDKGPNTGGMGAYAPAPVATPEIMARIQREAIQPTIDGMRLDDFPFVGCLFTGFMLTKDGPKVLEFNVRFGDPETQTLLPLLENDLAEVFYHAVNHNLDCVSLKFKNSFSTTVVVAAGGYPGSYAKNTPMAVSAPGDDTYIFHAGTAMVDSKLVTIGGRVIAATATAPSIAESVNKAYKGVECIQFDKMFFRKDIAHRALRQVQSAPSGQKEALTYASTGVSITAGNDLVTRIKPLLRRTKRAGIGADIGGFGGEVLLPAAGYHAQSPTILAGIDGIGTKLLLGKATGIYNTLGIDLVAMNANDLIVQGAEPLAFLDYYACGKLDVDRAAQFVEGVVEGCVRAGCGLIGGETAEMPGVYTNEDDWDAGGCCIGALKPEHPLLPVKDAMKEGDVLLGLASSGCHSNGFSLVRKVVERSGLSYNSPTPWVDVSGRTIGQALLEPTRLYIKPLLSVVQHNTPENLLIKGMAHITGGGLLENVPRMLPSSLAAHIEVGTWPVPPVLAWLKREGNLENREFGRVLNAGLGMVIAVDSSKVPDIKTRLEQAGEAVFEIGKLVKREGEGCVLAGIEKWNQL